MEECRRLGIYLVLPFFAVACVSQQIPEAEQTAYFTCRGIIIDGAAENLERAGYATGWREGDAAVETKWTGFTVERAGEKSTLVLRYVVEASNEGVHFGILQRSDGELGQVPWDRITIEQKEDPGVRRLLEKLRADVCGTRAPFFQVNARDQAPR